MKSPSTGFVSIDPIHAGVRGGPSLRQKMALALIAVIVTTAGHRSVGQTGAWQTEAPLPAARYGVAAQFVDGVLYAAGGNAGSDAANRVLYAYDPSTRSWTSRALMPAGRWQGSGAAAMNGKLWVIGGWTFSPPLPNNNLWMYDPSADTWTARASLPTLSGDGACAVISNKLYVTTPNDGWSGVRRMFHVYDPGLNSWTRLADSSTEHANGAAGVINGKFYLVGGRDASDAITGVLEVFDPAANVWTTRAAMPTARAGTCGTVLNGKLHVMGGYSGPTRYATMEVYDPVNNTWRTGTPMPTPRAFVAGAIDNGVIYVVGGHGTGSLATVESFRPGHVLLPMNIPCLAGSFPITIDSDSGLMSGTLTMSFTAQGTLQGQMLMDGVTFSVSGRHVTTKSKGTLLSLTAVNGGNRLKLAGVLQTGGAASFVGTTRGTGAVAPGTGWFTIDVSTAAPLVLDLSLDEVSSTSGRWTGSATVSACGWECVGQITARTVGTPVVSFRCGFLSWRGQGLCVDGEWTMTWVVTGFGTRATGTNTSLASMLCAYAVTPLRAAFDAEGGDGSINVTTCNGCAWSAISDREWLTVETAGGTGNGTVLYTVAANRADGRRTGTITVGDRLFTITQSGCEYSISPRAASFEASGGEGGINVNTGGDCGWSVVSHAGWIFINTGEGIGNGVASYSVDANPGPRRTGTITIGGKTITVTQAAKAGCSASISPASASFGSSGGGGSVTVTTPADCDWTAVSHAGWITVATSGGTGGGSVGYTVAVNSGTEKRTGTITIAKKTFTITQSGSGGAGGGFDGTYWVDVTTVTPGGTTHGSGIFTVSGGRVCGDPGCPSDGALKGTVDSSGRFTGTTKVCPACIPMNMSGTFKTSGNFTLSGSNGGVSQTIVAHKL
jgi:N-acetylneuraminic acid mutarotase